MPSLLITQKFRINTLMVLIFARINFRARDNFFFPRVLIFAHHGKVYYLRVLNFEQTRIFIYFFIYLLSQFHRKEIR